MAAAVLLSSGSASAFCRTTTEPGPGGDCSTTGIPVFWRNACLGIRLSTDAEPAVGQALTVQKIEAAFSAWSTLGCQPSITAMYLGTTTDSEAGYQKGSTNNQNIIVFRNETWPYQDRNQVALTTLTFRKDIGEILDADIEVNGTLKLVATDPLPSDGFDLPTVLAHELGHVLGLAHSSVQGATMFARYTTGTIEQRTLKADDEEGLCSIYPSDQTRNTAAGGIVATACDPEAQPDPGGNPGGCGCRVGKSDLPGSVSFGACCVAAGLLMVRRRGPKRVHTVPPKSPQRQQNVRR